ncbi:hypothetical protein NPIL_628201 [Nephila pilipes]|uniref:Uncharacterized protein n=1 Tax=Nephila pilipes TaxID=299642 RepID=A0A8X6PFJ5_NEPPI|nr:hypothetical protein NPIL_628201 [Nephila pilipes]
MPIYKQLLEQPYLVAFKKMKRTMTLKSPSLTVFYSLPPIISRRNPYFVYMESHSRISSLQEKKIEKDFLRRIFVFYEGLLFEFNYSLLHSEAGKWRELVSLQPFRSFSTVSSEPLSTPQGAQASIYE